MPTIYDIAKAAGVSVATVSRALRGRDEVVPEVRERILKIARELGYRPNRLAKALSMGKTFLIGLVVPRPAENPFYSSLIEAIFCACREVGYQAMTIMVDLLSEDSLAEAALQLEEHQVDGLLLFSSSMHLDAYMAKRDENSPPMIAIGPPSDFRGSMVRADEERAARILVQHLRELGHERIAFLGPTSSICSGSRQAGYLAAMAEAGLTPQMIECDAHISGPAHVLPDLLQSDDRPTALMCFNDFMALGALAAVQRAGLQVPQDCSVAGFDNLTIGAHAVPALTSVDLKVGEVASTAVQKLLELVDSKQPARVCEVIQPELVVRESTGPAPGV